MDNRDNAEHLNKADTPAKSPAEANTNQDAPKVISERKLAANRRNARASTGPKTQRGKRLARLNALKHGV